MANRTYPDLFQDTGPPGKNVLLHSDEWSDPHLETPIPKPDPFDTSILEWINPVTAGSRILTWLTLDTGAQAYRRNYGTADPASPPTLTGRYLWTLERTAQLGGAVSGKLADTAAASFWSNFFGFLKNSGVGSLLLIGGGIWFLSANWGHVAKALTFRAARR